MNENESYTDSIESFEDLMFEYSYHKEAGKIIGHSPMYGCVFYNTPYPYIFISDYNIVEGKPTAPGTLCIFNEYTGACTILAIRFVRESENRLIQAIESLKNPTRVSPT